MGKAATAAAKRNGLATTAKKPHVAVKRRIAKPAAEVAAPWFGCYAGALGGEYQAYMRNEWGHEKRGEVPLFEKLCLEGQQAGLSWATVLAKRAAYRKAFSSFNLKKCAAMSDKDVDRVLLAHQAGPGGRDAVICHRGKLRSIPHNARCVLALRSPSKVVPMDPATGRPCTTLDALLWSFVGGKPVLNKWKSKKDIPVLTPPAQAMSKLLKKLGFAFVGPTIAYSLMQSCGLVIDHPQGTPEHRAAAKRLARRR